MAQFKRMRHSAIVSAVMLILIITAFCVNGNYNCSKSLADRIEQYESSRNSMLERERYAQFGGKVNLDDREILANEYIMIAKRKEYEAGIHNPSDFKPAHQFHKVCDEISKTELFKLLKSMPKGGVLHAHDLALCSTDYLIELTYTENLWICISDETNSGYKSMRFSNDKPPSRTDCQWKLLQQLRNDLGADNVDGKLRKRLTVYSDDYEPNLSDVWKVFRGIFIFVSDLITYETIWAKYFYHALEEFYADGVQYVEMRSPLPILYNLNNDNFTILDTVRILEEMSEKFKEEHPDFIGSKLIYAPTRNVSNSVVAGYLENALLLKQSFPDYFAGFDLVGEEDAGRPLKDFAHQLLAVEDKIDFYFHAGETNWYGTSVDENLIDAVLLRTKRIGHGFALSKHPEVLRAIRADNIAVEVNPISNQALQHISDFRNHPSAFLFADNYQVVISSDDCSFLKSTPMTHDFYIAFLGIASKTADLGMLKLLAWNSLHYSAMTLDDREQAHRLWLQKWNAWIEKIAEMEPF